MITIQRKTELKIMVFKYLALKNYKAMLILGNRGLAATVSPSKMIFSKNKCIKNS